MVENSLEAQHFQRCYLTALTATGIAQVLTVVFVGSFVQKSVSRCHLQDTVLDAEKVT